MEEQLISFDTAKLAKEKGFNIPTRNFYADFTWKSIEVYSCIEVGYNEFTDSMENNHGFGDITLIPTQSLLQKWLREVHNCFIDILPHRDGDSKNKQWKNKEDVFWTVEVDYYGKNFEINLTNNADFTQHFNKSYEEALEIGLQEALKLIK